MTEQIDPQGDASPAAGTPGSAGCVVLLVDESAAMNTPVAGGTKSKAESIATAINSLLNQLSAGANLDVAVVGYRGDGQGGVDVGCRWGGPLAGQTFVHTSQLQAAPAVVESRVRRIPGPGGIGVEREETVAFPVWYQPMLGEAASLAAAYRYCQGLLEVWVATPDVAARPPLVISFLGDEIEPGSLAAGLSEIYQTPTPGGQSMVFHAHLSSSAQVPATLYPSADGHLPVGPVQEVFQWSSYLGEAFIAALGQFGVSVNLGARGMIFGAAMADLIRFLSLVKTYTTYEPPPPPMPEEAEKAPGLRAGDPAHAVGGLLGESTADIPQPPQAACIVLLLDRSVDDPAAEESRKAFDRLQQHANELLAEIAKQGGEIVEAALVTSGAGDLQTTFAGPLAGKTFACAGELADGPVRVDEVTEQVSNGIGGLIDWKRKKPIYVDLTPCGATPIAPAFEAAGRLIAEWRAGHADVPVVTIVVHLSCGRVDPAELEQAVGALRQSADEARLYELVVTQSPYRSLAYPAQAEGIEDATLLAMWQLSSPLLDAGRLVARRPTLTPESRGFVVNGKLDLLLPGILPQEGEAPAEP